MIILNFILFSFLVFFNMEYKRKINEVEKYNESLNTKEIYIKQLEYELLNKNDEIIEKEKLLNIRLEEVKKYNEFKIAYLTFDDGPSSNTEMILDILKQNNIKATFFVNGHPDQKNIYLRMKNEGHTIGNHTYSHSYAKEYKSVDSFFLDVDNLNNYLLSIGIDKTNILRFPGGSNNTVSFKYGGKELMNDITKESIKRGYKYYDWNVSSGDAAGSKVDKNKIISNVLDGSKGKNKAVILMHDSKVKITTVESLQEIITGLKSQGFIFDKITENTEYNVKFK